LRERALLRRKSSPLSLFSRGRRGESDERERVDLSLSRKGRSLGGKDLVGRGRKRATFSRGGALLSREECSLSRERKVAASSLSEKRFSRAFYRGDRRSLASKDLF